ncbi:MAG TPA: hypothetical protein VG842_09045 [Sediminibacterium sp.]|nr:hypothetical protein [Sediminibacterium sp.]
MTQVITPTSVTKKQEDVSGTTPLQPISGNWIFPQCMAAYTGLKKLLEKDYLREEEDPATLLSSLSDRLARIW